jgi:hypothetical protein
MSLEYRVASLESDVRRCQSELENIRNRARDRECARSDFWTRVIVFVTFFLFTIGGALILKPR